MGLYSEKIFPRLYDCLMDKPFWEKHRSQQLSSVDGEVLEIGVGTGLNLPHYPDHIKRITTVEPNPGMHRRLQQRIAKSGIDVDKRTTGGESLPFEDDTFDCIVSTVTLCSIRKVEAALGELYRVLVPGGRMLFLEHGISPDAKVALWQRRLDRFQRIAICGCSLTLDIPSVLATQPFRSVEIDCFNMENTPKTHGYMYRGTATK